MFTQLSKSEALGRATLAVNLILASVTLGQKPPVTPSPPPGIEFPVTMRQNVVAGKTPVGSKIQAKLTVATLVKGVVIPQNAILSGEVIESVAKSATDPSRLAIRMDSAEWKNGSAPVTLPLPPKIYLTAWYYPDTRLTNRDMPDDPTGMAPSSNQRYGTAPSAIPNTLPPQSYPTHDNNGSRIPPGTSSNTSQHRVLMKNIESTHNNDGALTLTSRRFNIKLDKDTTYVLAAADLPGGPR